MGMRIFTATELADELNVQPKAFRSFVRSLVRSNGGKVGEQTPGSGGRYRFECDDDDDAVASFIDGWRVAYQTHRKTNNTRTIDLASLVGSHDDASSPDDDADGVTDDE